MSHKRFMIYSVESDDKSIEYHIGVLISKILLSKEDEKVYILCENLSQSEIINDKLWTFSPNHFIPHDMIENITRNIEKHPVIICSTIEQISNLEKSKILCIYGNCDFFTNIISHHMLFLEKFDDILFFYNINNEDNNLDLTKFVPKKESGFEIVKFIYRDKSWHKEVA